MDSIFLMMRAAMTTDNVPGILMRVMKAEEAGATLVSRVRPPAVVRVPLFLFSCPLLR